METTYNTRYPVAKCARCWGDGYFAHWQHVANGVCFLCGGTKYKLNPKGRGLRKRVKNGNAEVPQPHSVEPSIYCDCPHCEERPERSAQRDIEWKMTVTRQSKRNEKRQAEAASKRAAWEQASPEEANLLAALIDMDEEDGFALSLHRGVRDFGNLTEKQAAALPGAVERTRNFIERVIDSELGRQAEYADAADVPTGTVEITGEVVTIKWQEGKFGNTEKMLVKDERGFKVWGTVPRSLWSDTKQDDEGNLTHLPGVEEGDTVKFTATVERSKDDPKFGFFKRPRAAEFVARAEKGAT